MQVNKNTVFQVDKFKGKILISFNFFLFSWEKVVFFQCNISPTPFLVRRQGHTRMPRMPLPVRPWLAGWVV